MNSLKTNLGPVNGSPNLIEARRDSNITIANITTEVKKFNSSLSPGILRLDKINVWMEEANKRPIPKRLFDDFWFEGEICILFADTNVGKSILAVQIADSISRGTKISGFSLTARKQQVIYYDFELGDKQFENRYSENYENHYKFSENLMRAEVDPDAEIPIDKSFEELIIQSIDKSIIQTEAKILIIDNITYLKDGTEKAKDALPLMKSLKQLKNNYNLSILVLAHTPKRDLSKPITQNDLQGSKMIINFCDSAFTIGESQQDKSIRYLKQIKARNTEIIYDASNIYLCSIEKPTNFLRFSVSDFGNEKDHLKRYSGEESNELEGKIMELHQNQPHLSYREIGKSLNTNHMKVKRTLNKNKSM